MRQAIQAPSKGAPAGRPSAVVAAPGLVDEVRYILREEGIRAAVEEVATPDWAEDGLTELVGHLSGRVQVADAPSPEDWALVHQQAAAYALTQPWERRADDVHLALELRIGSGRADGVAIVLGNAGAIKGLFLSPGRDVPEALTSDRKGAPPPAGASASRSSSGRKPGPRCWSGRSATAGRPPSMRLCSSPWAQTARTRLIATRP